MTTHVIITTAAGRFEFEGEVRVDRRVEAPIMVRGRQIGTRVRSYGRVLVYTSTPPEIPTGEVDWADIDFAGQAIRVEPATIGSQRGGVLAVWVEEAR